MPAKDASQIKEKIILMLKRRGPSLPIHVARETELSALFASAFLSELFSENLIKISNMRIGSSPLYFMPGQEIMLENFSEFLKGKEKEAFLLIKDKKFLRDSSQEPAIRVALRAIKDFAIPFEKDNEICWRYFKASESEFKTEDKKVEEQKTNEVEKQLNISDKTEEEKSEQKVPEKVSPKDSEEKVKKLKPAKKKTSAKLKANEKFLERIKEFLSKSSTEIMGIEGLKKDEIILKIKIKGEEQLLLAYNKKKITEKEIIKAGKKASENGLKYSILSLGELPKKVSELIDALKDIKTIGKVE
ncbi:MAG TPA: hypothetical protein VJ208_01490 [Candidatus Nanoarchaeia archaeon]|nr:hypothetical protein [Candidatus Nanoarchaeia archaeon]